jgi:hypothetical protein
MAKVVPEAGAQATKAATAVPSRLAAVGAVYVTTAPVAPVALVVMFAGIPASTRVVSLTVTVNVLLTGLLV